MDLSSSIKNNHFFGSLKQEAISSLASAAMLRHYKFGQIIFSNGDTGEGLYLVADGQVKIYLESSEGKELLLYLLGSSDIFGETTVFLNKDHGHHLSAQAASEAAIIFFKRKELHQQMTIYPEIAFGLLAAQAHRMASLTFLLESLIMKEVPARLAAFILNGANKDGLVRLHFSKGQLAATLGVSPETLSRAIGRFKKAGIIDEKRPYIVILDREQLIRLAHGMPTPVN
ncbi:MAG: Crp/Fnr family transcriptional regulator [Candidatus Adiutrix sp.]|jgi:CRP/FNR family transcriptional regulator|nr:Crp/Fnr family transcriptional regulator [Candidatus Adiutrix sp.]